MIQLLKELNIKACPRNLMTFDTWMTETVQNVHYRGLTADQFEVIIKKFD